jgi:hypothetical protein
MVYIVNKLLHLASILSLRLGTCKAHTLHTRLYIVLSLWHRQKPTKYLKNTRICYLINILINCHQLCAMSFVKLLGMCIHCRCNFIIIANYFTTLDPGYEYFIFFYIILISKCLSFKM